MGHTLHVKKIQLKLFRIYLKRILVFRQTELDFILGGATNAK